MGKLETQELAEKQKYAFEIVEMAKEISEETKRCFGRWRTSPRYLARKQFIPACSGTFLTRFWNGFMFRESSGNFSWPSISMA